MLKSVIKAKLNKQRIKTVLIGFPHQMILINNWKFISKN